MMKAYKLYLITVLIIFSTLLKAQNLATSNPEDIGISSDTLGAIDRVLQEYIEKKEVPGTVALIARKGKIGYLKSFGMKDIEENQPITNDAIFRIASMTKDFCFAKIHAGLNEMDLAFDYLEKAAVDRTDYLVFLDGFRRAKLIPSFTDNPRLLEYIERVGIPHHF